MVHIVVVGGGTGTNSIAPVFHQIAHKVSYVIPISDNGGSTSEIMRLFGGPAIGDARSRLVRLMEQSPLQKLLAMRLPDNSELAARDWSLIVDGTHAIWADVAAHMKHMYRPFLIHAHAEILKRSTSKPFDFSRASVGNLFLTGARLFFGSLEAAIELVLHTARIPDTTSVLPCISTNFSYHIAAQLHDGTVVMGQTEISHPSSISTLREETYLQSIEEDGNIPFAHPNLSSSQIAFDKGGTASLPSPIKYVYYVNPFGDEIRPVASLRTLTALSTADAVVLSVGSLYTSIIPVLVLRKFSTSMPRRCILLLNGSKDRETEFMTPSQYVEAINDACEYSITGAPAVVNAGLGSGAGEIDMTGKCAGGSHKTRDAMAPGPRRQYVTHVIYPEGILSPREVRSLQDATSMTVPAGCINGEYVLGSLSEVLKTCLWGHDGSTGVVGL